MVKEFSVEMDGQKQMVALKTPPNSFRRVLLEYMAQKSKEMQAKGGDKWAEQNPVEALEVAMSIEQKKKEILIELCTNGTLKSISDADKISNPDMMEMFVWLENSLGITKGEDKKNFTNSSK